MPEYTTECSVHLSKFQIQHTEYRLSHFPSSNEWIVFYCDILSVGYGVVVLVVVVVVDGGASVWMLYDVDAFTDLNLNKARKYSSLVMVPRLEVDSRYTLRTKCLVKINGVKRKTIIIIIIIASGSGLR